MSGRSSLRSVMCPRPFDKEAVKRIAFHEHDMVVINLNDPNLSWIDREEAKRIGQKIYGALPVGRRRA